MNQNTKGKFHYAWLILITCCLLPGIGVGLVSSTISIYITPVTTELGISVGEFTLYNTICSLTCMVFLPFAGRIFVKVNPRVLLTVVVIIQMITYACMGLQTTAVGFYICGVILGICQPFPLYLAVPTLVSNWFATGVSSKMGIAMSFTGLGAAVCSPIVNALITAFGWRMTYPIMAGASAIILIPLLLFVVRFKPADKGLLPYGTEKVDVSSESITIKASGLPAAKATKTSAFWILIMMTAITCIPTAFVSYASPVAQSVGYNAATAATFASLFTLGLTAGKMLLGFLVDMMKTWKAFGIMFLCGILGIFIFMGNFSTITSLIGFFMLGVAVPSPSAGCPMLARLKFGTLEYTKINSYVSMMVSLGGALAISIIGFAYNYFGSYMMLLKVFIGIYATAAVLIYIFDFLKVPAFETEE